ncbi:MAG: RNA polymerase sigma factor [Melioribacteraceae bacterium]|nr:RNA polymerase sigma factor [Melioribacteraceae bacterium]
MPGLNQKYENEAELVSAVKNDDKKAFSILYNQYFEMLIRFAFYRTGSMQTAREYVQEIFFRMWINRKHLNPEKSIKAYMYKSLNNFVISQNKLHSSRNISIDSIGNNELRSIEENDSDIDFRSAVDSLPEKIKSVFILSRIDGFKYSEIAEICSISVKAVEKRMSKALGMLRKIFNSGFRK